MFDTAGLILLMVLIGAILGGGTNVLAIRMIFRPFEAVRIGGIRIPFTPGLVPKRREEIADRLGRMVEDYLLTPEGVQSKLSDSAFTAQLEARIERGIDELLKDQRTVDEWVSDTFERQGNTAEVRRNLEANINQRIAALIDSYKSIPIKETVPQAWLTKAEEAMPKVSRDILVSFETYLISDEGQDQLGRMVARFFDSRGSVGGMLGRVVNRFSLVSVITKELTRFVKDEQTEQMVTRLLIREMHQLTEKKPVDLYDDEQANEQISILIRKIVNEIPIVGEWDKPIHEWGGAYRQLLDESIIPALMAGTTSLVSKYLSRMMRKIGIRDVVRDQVNQFPIEQLEQMIISVAMRELKLIALLGALIGGGIGLLQAILFLLFA
ncbi:DUF445 family protein [Salisediminibacterium selenitireducens]|uniref:Uncharacterized protein n=1 Tax=Bacillus selenitireducens (strain ATCC 700615 / DSM 15326 / MLS10) TaxID=439292 RepID=D6XX24_BACIE|nr:DUF445 family protein [Salisediminibacterium selenitireducens]ADI00001.1 protein of unknown function DUF445 [[Bacillus] selenitireducens MLS10]